jgi:hypothetical protein
MVLIKVVLEVLIGDLIAFFVFAVEFTFFLDGVVGEVDHQIEGVFKCERGRGGTEIAFIVPISFDFAIEARN